MNNRYFHEILGLKPGATREAIKHAYHDLAKKNHPDLFPPDKREIQELKMMVLNEAYLNLAAHSDELRHGDENGYGPAGTGKHFSDTDKRNCSGNQVAFHRDPAYAYYKQGFLNFSQAIHGIAGVNRKVEQKKNKMVRDFAYSLKLLRVAHTYFSRVVEEYNDSIWSTDAQFKLNRIEGFTFLYRKILHNITNSTCT
ncbi:MAG: J domain-containing protein [Spirochaetota bacterium]